MVRTFASAFLADCAERWKPATRANYVNNVRRWILPAFGNRPVDAIGTKDVRRWFDGIAATHPGSSNWALASMSSMMKHAEAFGLRREDSNPCKGMRRRKTGFEAHHLTEDEFAALGRALDGAEADHPVAVPVVRFLLYTGPCRPRGAATAHQLPLGVRVALRQACNGGQGMERDSRSGGTAGTAHSRSPAQPRGGRGQRRRGATRRCWIARPCRHLICGGSGRRPATRPESWRMPSCMMRHAHASHAVMNGESLHVAGRLLGHRRATTTNRYVHLNDATLSEAAERVAVALKSKLQSPN